MLYRKVNLNSILHAKQILFSGGQLLLYPDGFPPYTNWSTGLVRLLKTFKDSDSIYYVMEKFVGVKSESRINARPLLRRSREYHPTITFSEAIPISQLFATIQSSKKTDIATELRNRYINWQYNLGLDNPVEITHKDMDRNT